MWDFINKMTGLLFTVLLIALSVQESMAGGNRECFSYSDKSRNHLHRPNAGEVVMSSHIQNSMNSHINSFSASGIHLLASSGCADTALAELPTFTQGYSLAALSTEKEKLELSDTAVRKQVSELLGIINQRLAVMPAIAQAKSSLGMPVFDPTRESAVLKATVLAAKQIGLPESLAVHFMKGQIEAAKLVQKQDQKIGQRKAAKASEPLPRQKAEQLLKTSRETLSSMTQPLLEALNQIADNLCYRTVTNEIDRQLSTQEPDQPLYDSLIASRKKSLSNRCH